jgi:hypothetical protein
MLWFHDSGSLDIVLSEVLNGNDWARTVLTLVSEFSSLYPGLNHTSRVAEILTEEKRANRCMYNEKSRVEEEILRGLWISVVRWKRRDLAHRVSQFLKENCNTFVNQGRVVRYMHKFSNPLPYIIASTLKPTNQTTLD